MGAAHEWSDENLFWDREDVRRRRGNSGEQPPRTLNAGEAAGPLWGGSLIVLGLLLGTGLWPEPAPGSLVFLEADGMPVDELSARLEQFRLAGVFDRAAGVIMGKIGNPQATPSGYTGYDEVLRGCLPPGLPAAAGFDLGHADPNVHPAGRRAGQVDLSRRRSAPAAPAPRPPDTPVRPGGGSSTPVPSV